MGDKTLFEKKADAHKMPTLKERSKVIFTASPVTIPHSSFLNFSLNNGKSHFFPLVCYVKFEKKLSIQTFVGDPITLISLKKKYYSENF